MIILKRVRSVEFQIDDIDKALEALKTAKHVLYTHLPEIKANPYKGGLLNAIP